MAYLVRKLVNRENMKLFEASIAVEDMDADFATKELRTTKGTLSAWHIDDICGLNEAVLAIASTSEKLDKMDFIVINTDYLAANSLAFEQTYAGREIAVNDLQNSHYDIIGITVPKLMDCELVYRKINDDDGGRGEYLVRYPKTKIKDLLKNAIQNKRLDECRLTERLRNELK